MRGDEAQYEYQQAHEAKHAANQQCAVTRVFLAAGDVLQRLLVGVDQVGTDLIERSA
ncbi:hypothetical protein D3C79_1061770 [compost metagenome]